MLLYHYCTNLYLPCLSFLKLFQSFKQKICFQPTNPYNLNIFYLCANQAWSIDITYIPMKHGFLYLTAIIDWYSRYIAGWDIFASFFTTNYTLSNQNLVVSGYIFLFLFFLFINTKRLTKPYFTMVYRHQYTSS